VAGSFGLLTATPAHATSADYTVTNCDGAGAGSLPYGVNQLNNAAGGTIDFSSELNCSTIVVTESMNYTKPLTITGPSNATVTIKPVDGGWYPFFLSNEGTDLTLSNLTFDGNGGNGDSGSLARMYNSGASDFDLNLNNLHITNMSNWNAISLEAGNLHLNATTMSDDDFERADSAIWAPHISIIDSEFIGNGYAEGSLINAWSSLTVSNSKFDNNDMQWGGGYVLTGPEIEVTNSQFINNNATSVIASSTSTSVSGSSIVSSTTDTSLFSANGGSLTLSNNTVAENVYGSGYSVMQGVAITATFNTFLNNEENNLSVGTVISGTATLGGNIFASDEGYVFRCLDVSTADDMGGNMFTSQPENCGLPTLPTTAANAASAVVSWDDLKIQAQASATNGEKYYSLGTGSVGLDYVSTLSDTDFLLDVDQLGNVRPNGTARDAGSIEWYDTDPAPTCTSATVKGMSVLFTPHSWALSKVAKKRLSTFARSLKAHGCVAIKINGHTSISATGQKFGKWYDLMLAKKRNKAVNDYLHSLFNKLGIHVTSRRSAYGSITPKASNKTALGRSLNRRVEITVVHTPQ
jgi:outer membrane protein OmpA-like peptidoglycan-associated protein